MEGWKTDDLAADTFIDRRTADGSRIGNADIQRQFYQRLRIPLVRTARHGHLVPAEFCLVDARSIRCQTGIAVDAHRSGGDATGQCTIIAGRCRLLRTDSFSFCITHQKEVYRLRAL